MAGWLLFTLWISSPRKEGAGLLTGSAEGFLLSSFTWKMSSWDFSLEFYIVYKRQ